MWFGPWKEDFTEKIFDLRSRLNLGRYRGPVSTMTLSQFDLVTTYREALEPFLIEDGMSLNEWYGDIEIPLGCQLNVKHLPVAYPLAVPPAGFSPNDQLFLWTRLPSGRILVTREYPGILSQEDHGRLNRGEAFAEFIPAIIVSEDPLPPRAEILDDVRPHSEGKDYARSKWERKRERKCKDLEDALRSERARVEKLKKKLASMGRKKAKPGTIPSDVQPHMSNPFVDWYKRPVEGEQKVCWMNMYTDIAGALKILSESRDFDHAISNVIGIALLKIDISQYDVMDKWFVNLLKKESEDGIPDDAGPQGWGADLAARINDFRHNLSRFEDTPLFEAIKSAMAICIYTGLVPQNEESDSKLISFLKNINGMKQEIGELDFAHAFLQISEFALEFFDLLTLNPSGLGMFLFPSSIHSQFSRLKGLKDAWRVGNLKLHGYDEERLYEEAFSLKVDLDIIITGIQKGRKRVPPTMVVAYSQFYSQMCAMVAEIEQARNAHSIRKRPYAACFYGRSKIGKTSIMKQVIKAVCATYDIPHADKDTWYGKDGKYDDDLDGSKTVYVFDDLCNAKIKAGESLEHICARFIKFINNTVCLANMAEADMKGKIAYEPRLIIMSTNMRYLLADMFSNDIESFFSRINMFEVEVNDRYKDTETGKLNSDAAFWKPVHKVTQYFPTDAKDMKATIGRDIIPKKSKEPSLTHKNGTTWNSTQEFIPWIVRDFGRHDQEQDKILQQLKDLEDAVMCPTHKKFLSWCHMEGKECKKCEPEPSEEEIPEDVGPHAATVLEMATKAVSSAYLLDIMAALGSMQFPRVQRLFSQAWMASTVKCVLWMIDAYLKTSTKNKMYIAFTGTLSVSMFLVMYGMFLLTAPYVCLGITTICIYSFVSWFAAICDLAGEASHRVIRNTIVDGAKPATTSAKLIAVVAGLAALRKMLSLYERMSDVQPHAFFAKDQSEAKERAAEPNPWVSEDQESKWVKRAVERSHTSHEISTMTSEQFSKEVKNRMVQVLPVEGTIPSYGFAINGQTILFPWHFIARVFKGRDAIKVTMARVPATQDNRSSGMIYKPRRIDNLDLGTVLFEGNFNLGDGTNLLEEDDWLRDTATLHRWRDNEWREDKILWESTDSMRNNTGCNFRGSGYDVACSSGDCMSPIIGHSKPYRIRGFHIGGSDSVAWGCGIWAPPKVLRAHIGKHYDVMPHSIQLDTFELDAPLTPLVDSVHPKCCTNFIPREYERPGSIHIWGGVPQSNVQPRSKFVPSAISDKIEGVDDIWGPSKFKRNHDYSNYFHCYLDGMSWIDRDTLQWAVDDYVDGLMPYVSGYELDGPAVLSVDEAVNGAEFNRHVGPIDLTTAGGPGFKSPKSEFVAVAEIDGVFTRTIPDELRDIVDQRIQDLKDGKLHLPRVRTGLKDEITVREDILGKRKVRIFYVFPTHFLLTGKMLFGNIHTFLTSFPQVSELMGGLNSTSVDWSEVHDHIFEHDNIFEGDYSKYDTRQSNQLMMAAAEVCARLARELGYDEEECTAIRMYVQAMSWAALEWNGVCMTLHGLLKSGVWITLLLNGICNALLHRCAFKDILNEPITPPFQSLVRVGFQGDDALGSTKEKRFNMRAIQKWMKKHGMPYTDANKSEVMPLFVEKATASFCGRTWRWDEKFQIWDAPLRVGSIWKSLFWHRNGAMSSETVLHDCVFGKLLEMSCHGEEFFDKHAEMLFAAMQQLGYSKDIFRHPTCWDGVMRYRVTHHYLRPADRNLDMIEDHRIREVEDVNPHSCRRSVFEVEQVSPKATGFHTDGYPSMLGRLDEASCGRMLHNDGGDWSLAYRPKVKQRTSEINFSQQTSPARADVAETVTFNSIMGGWRAGATALRDSTMGVSKDEQTVASVLERPIQIAQFEWTPGEFTSFRFDPWKLFIENELVADRIKYFHLMRGNLKLRVLVNGGPFYYGRLICAYTYLPDYDYNLNNAEGSQSVITQLSQYPHFFIDPRDSEGGEIVCPFVYPHHSMVVPAKEWRELGDIHLYDVNSLAHANGALDPVTITVLAWLQDFEVNVPTFHTEIPPDVGPQSGEGEYGMVSGPLHKASDFMGHLKEVPWIGPYAKATQMVTGGMSRIFKLFGYSSPREIKVNMTELVQQPELSVTDTQFRGGSLAVSAKQETTIDPRFVGAPPQDELAIISIANRWSYLTKFEWSDTDAPGTHLFSIRNKPMQGYQEDGLYQLLPSAFATLPFESWTGPCEVMFQVVCSNYHKGRLSFVFDPWYAPAGSGREFNKGRRIVQDISASTEEKICMTWCQQQNYLPTIEDQPWSETFPSFSTTPYDFIDPTANGTLSVFVTNSLTTPSPEPQTVEVNVFFRAGEGFKVHQPTQRWLDLVEIERQVPITSPADPPTESVFPSDTSPSDTLIPISGGPGALLVEGFGGNSIDAQDSVGVNQTDSILLKTGSQIVRFLAYGAGANPGPITIRLRQTGTGNSTLTWNDDNSTPRSETFTGIGDTMDVVLNLSGFVSGNYTTWQYNYTGFSRLAVESVTTDVPDNGVLREVDANTLSNFFEGVYDANTEEFTLTGDQPAVMPDLMDGTVLSWSTYLNTVGGESYQTAGVLSTIPDGTTIRRLYYLGVVGPQSGDVDVELPKKEEEGNPEPLNCDDTIQNGTDMNPNDGFFGENIASFRTLLKRFSKEYHVSTATGGGINGYVLPHFPGNTPLETNTQVQQLRQSPTTLFRYLRSAFLTERGGMRIRVIDTSSFIDGECKSFALRRTPEQTILSPQYTKNYSFAVADRSMDVNSAGAVFSFTQSTGTVGCELPWYNRARFWIPRQLITSWKFSFFPWYELRANMAGTCSFDVMYATAEDYQLSIFCAVPLMNLTDPIDQLKV